MGSRWSCCRYNGGFDHRDLEIMDGLVVSCYSHGEDACTGLATSVDELKERAGTEPTFEHGEWWVKHLFHATQCMDGEDTEYTLAALQGLRLWQEWVSTQKKLTLYPFGSIR